MFIPVEFELFIVWREIVCKCIINSSRSFTDSIQSDDYCRWDFLVWVIVSGRELALCWVESSVTWVISWSVNLLFIEIFMHLTSKSKEFVELSWERILLSRSESNDKQTLINVKTRQQKHFFASSTVRERAKRDREREFETTSDMNS